jgi:hypothetical protein
VLHGWGGAGDTRAGAGIKLLQIAGGFAHVFTGDGLLPAPLSFGLGTAVIALAAFAAIRASRAGGGQGGRWLPFAFCGLAAVPLLAADWAVGARYFYLPAVGLAWAVAEALAGATAGVHGTIAFVLLLLGGMQGAQRRADVVSHDRRVAAARRAVASGLASGHRVFHIMGLVKDLDLAVKDDPALAGAVDHLLVLTDVPASFVIIPAELENAAAPLVARPPIPPSGAYRFGPVRVVGLVRRGDEPSLSEVVQLFPEIRFIRLLRVGSGQIIARDVTDQMRRALDEEGLDGDPDGGQD